METKVSPTQAEKSAQILCDIFDPQEKPVAYTILRHVSSSGMTRDISVVVSHEGRLRDITWHVAQVLGYKPKDTNGKWACRVRGCGMDMGFHLIYELSYKLYTTDPDRLAGRAGYVISQEWA